MATFLFEIGYEEMPARFLAPLAKDMRTLLAEGLEQTKIEYEDMRVNVTARRLSAEVTGMSEITRQEEEVAMGPPAKIAYDSYGAPTPAATGFAKGQGVVLEDVFVMETKKGDYLAVRKKTGGEPSLSILPSVCMHVLERLSFPKKMRWGSQDATFGRPVRWVVGLLDEKVVDFTFAGVVSGRTTYGHRVMGNGPWEIPTATDYESLITDQGRIVTNAQTRLDTIIQQCQALAGEVDGMPVFNDSLLQEVSGLVEAPMVVRGAFDKKYLEVPREVLLSSMEGHQKSFGIEGKNGELLPYFLTTINLVPKDLELVRKGWERVLKARLEDARFFWEADLSVSLERWLEKLEHVVFLGPLGSMGDKSRRLERLCGMFAKSVNPQLLLDLSQAGRLAKADLVSEMVGEFAELQGIMGSIYTKRKGESEKTATAIGEQYLPEGPDSPVPSSLSGALLAMADKLDTMAGCFGLDMVPTGAADPYALRRAALGVCRILMEHNLHLSLSEIVDNAFAGYEGTSFRLSVEEARDKLLDFISQRLRAYFQGKGYATKVVEAALGGGVDDVPGLAARLAALDEFSQSPDFEQAVLTFKRAANIIRKQGDEAGVELSGVIRPELFAEQAERDLAGALETTGPRFDELWTQSAFSDLFGLLGELRPVVDGFFDNVMVMCDDADIRVNRLNLLLALVSRLGRLADFSALQV
ncbi:glycine--tRNA ligase subunit beta [Desulfovibrio inopinatus]|uniref:glycine--tRNA ligase subunit beta n=1 Tax=Desulfovibrio inopinatus TaxID=102109 RepID=UPI0004244896|nr:glycine--tRNA ligase subunit beta [Desulfovibrio inopinatus]